VLKALIQRHLKFTNSQVARRILLNWDKEKVNFKKVFPREYKRALAESAAIKKAEEQQEKMLKESGESHGLGEQVVELRGDG
jgi:glutamate synthase domain-containing protein 3